MSSTRSVKSPGVWAADATTTIPGSPLSGVAYRRTSVVTADAREGWPFDTLVDSAEFNELLYRYTSLTDIMDRQGVLGWSDQVDYAVPAIVFGSDGVLYKSLGTSGPTTTTRDPISNPTYWSPVDQAASVQGAFKNLKLSATGTSAPVTITADAVVVSTGSVYKTLTSVSLSPSLAVSGANGLDTGTSATSTWYSVWVIWSGSTVAGLLSLSETAPTMPSGYTFKARVGWIRTDGAANKWPLPFRQHGRGVTYTPEGTTNLTSYPETAASGVSVGPISVSVSNFVPPTAGDLRLRLRQDSVSGVANASGIYSTSTSEALCNAIGVNGAQGVAMATIKPKVPGTVYWAVTTTTGAAALAVVGWEDNL